MTASPDTTVWFANPKTRELVWESHPGPQSRALRHQAFEILYGGARGGGKTQALMAWLALGNWDLPDSHPCRWSYLNHPKYAALVLRRNYSDLKDFVKTAQDFFRNFGLVGGKKKDDPPEFHFVSGAVIYTNHLENEEAYDKYKGWNLTKIGIEELTLIETENAYLKVLGSARSPDPSIMKAQVFCTTNPDGAGSAWVRNRFVHLLDRQGRAIPWGSTVRDPYSGLTRVFIPAKLRDNPALGDEYLATLRLQDEKTRRAWIDGDWDALVGNYFSSLRVNGPLDGEPPEARHVIRQHSVPLMGWWPRYIGVDWGFADNAACVWLCHNQQDRRLHVYDEFVRNEVGAEELGVKIAERTLPDLIAQPDLQVPLFLSHDAFAVRDVTKTTAELIQKGIESVLGPGSVQAMVGKFGAELSAEEIYDLPDFDSGANIVLYRAGRERVMVWQHIRSLLRYERLVEIGEPNLEYARHLLEGPDGFVKQEAYLRAFAELKARQENEVLPGILFWDNCVQLIEEMSTAVHDPKKPEDILDVRQGSSHMDALQALRHAIMHLMRQDNRIPYRHYVAQRMADAPTVHRGDPFVLRQMHRKVDADYRKSTPGLSTGRFLRSSSRERLTVQ